MIKFLNKGIRNILIAAAVTCVATMPVEATVGKWKVSPGFQHITRIASDMYVAKQGKNVGVLGTDGRWIVNPTADSITSFRNGYALVLSSRADDTYRLMGILDENKHLTFINEDYILGEYPFFSENLLGVYFKGKAGYINPEGEVVVPFKFSSPQPFSEGLAAVAKKSFFDKAKQVFGERTEPMLYINTQGRELKLPKSLGKIILASTFRKGEALVKTQDGEYFYINAAGKILRKENSGKFAFDDLGAVTATGSVSPEPTIAGIRDNVRLFENKGIYGYREGETVVIPLQFSYAGEFINDAAPACAAGKWGILGLADGNFGVKLEVMDSVPQDTSCIIAKMKLLVPESLRHLDLGLVIEKNNKRFTSETLEPYPSGRYELSFQFPKKDGNIKIMDDAMIIWELSMLPGGFDTDPAPKELVSASLSASRVKANAKDAASVTLILKNNSRREISAPLKVKGAYTAKKKIVIPPNGSVNVPVSFAKILKKETRTITVTVGDATTTCRIALEPFFSE